LTCYPISIISGWKTYFFIIPLTSYPEASFDYLKNSLVQFDFGFDYFDIYVDIDIILLLGAVVVMIVW